MIINWTTIECSFVISCIGRDESVTWPGQVGTGLWIRYGSRALGSESSLLWTVTD